MPVMPGEEVTFRANKHDGKGTRPRAGRVVAVQMPDGSSSKIPFSYGQGYSGGLCFEHRVEINKRLQPTLPYYTINTKSFT